MATSFFILLLAGTCSVAFSQNTTSPYSILGIGDIDTKDFGRYFSSGNASIARRDENSYNFSNPASLTSLPFKTMNLDISFRGRVSNFKSNNVDSVSANSKDFVLKRITMAFRVSEKTAIAFGLKPFSSVNYQYSTNQVLGDGTGDLSKNVEGQGGINQVYFSYAKILGKRFHAGVTGSWLFGSLNKETQYYSELANLNITKSETDFYYGASILAGLQFESKESKQFVHRIGLTASANTKLKGQLTTIFSDATDELTKETESGRSFKMPLSLGAGYAVTMNKVLTISADANYYKWPYQKLNYANSYTDQAYRFSGGIEYAPKKKLGNIRTEQYYIGAGISYEKNYMTIQKNALTDLSVSIGGGYNVARNIYLHAGIEMGKKGSLSSNQIKESYTQFVMGFTLKDIWIGAKRFGRFN